MLKKILVLLLLIFFSSLALADITLVSPVSGIFRHEDFVFLGSMQPGETLEIIAASDVFLPARSSWTNAGIEKSSLPAGWRAFDSSPGQTLIARVFAPANAGLGSYDLKLLLSDDSGKLLPETLNLSILIRDDLVNSSISGLEQEATAGQPASYTLTVINDSIAVHRVKIDSTLPRQWFSPKTLEVGPKQTIEEQLQVNPRSYGEKSFNFKLSSALNSSPAQEFYAGLKVQPTLKSKFVASSFGFPFFTPSLLPYYLINAFLGELI